jgi:hypothetical protein
VPGLGRFSTWSGTNLRVHFGDAPEAERRKVREQLERCYGQDTEGMIWIVDALRNLGWERSRLNLAPMKKQM